MTDLTQSEAFNALKDIIRRAIMTLLALKDADRKYRVRTSAWPFPVVDLVPEAYGYVSYGFVPTPADITQMEIVAVWLAWLRRRDERDFKRIWAWTLGIPMHRIGQAEGVSEKSARNRIDRSVAEIIREFVKVDVEIETVEEPYESPYRMIVEKCPGPHGEVKKLAKIYIHGKGMLRGSRKDLHWHPVRSAGEMGKIKKVVGN